MKHQAVAIAIALSVMGCAAAWPAYQMLPPANYFAAPASQHDSKEVRLFQEGEIPSRPFVRIAAVAAHGNGYADRGKLEETLREQAAELGADLVLVVKGEITKDETIGTYGGGIYLANQITRPHLYGTACRWATAAIGMNFDEEGVIQYVKEGSPASKAGLREGHQIVALNGKYLKSDRYVFDREVSAKQPGNTVQIEIMSRGKKYRTIVTLGKP